MQSNVLYDDTCSNCSGRSIIEALKFKDQYFFINKCFIHSQKEHSIESQLLL